MQNILLYTKLIITFFVTSSSEETCDDHTETCQREGNLGESNLFPWLGVLKINYFDGTEHRLAATGIVLVKHRYGIASAHDIIRIPKAVIKRDGKAYFIPKKNEPWFAYIVDYNIHPEYEYVTYNTIALVELDTMTHKSSAEYQLEVTFPMLPVCWPTYAYNTSNELYVMGYTDERALFEKIAYRVTFVEQDLCKQFYSKAGVQDREMMSRFICGVATSNKQHCSWDSGMVLASNATKVWTLIGFGFQNPGCAGPARFLDLTDYKGWIQTSTSVEEMAYDYAENK